MTTAIRRRLKTLLPVVVDPVVGQKCWRFFGWCLVVGFMGTKGVRRAMEIWLRSIFFFFFKFDFRRFKYLEL